jgi:hypothetical protein
MPCLIEAFEVSKKWLAEKNKRKLDAMKVKPPPSNGAAEIYGRNGFGGMTGQKHFVAIVSDVANGVWLEGTTPQNTLVAEWNRYCAGSHGGDEARRIAANIAKLPKASEQALRP